ncbi:MAG: response regulator [Lacibacter sp.]
MSTPPVTLAIVDDHQIVIDGLKALLKGSSDYKIIFETTNPQVALRELPKYEPDILITDMMMPGLNGVELAGQLKKILPRLKIIALSMNGEGSLVNQMIQEADISGYLLKNIGQTEFLQALQKVESGGIYFNESVLDEMLKASEQKQQQEETHLTPREIEVIRLIEKEYSNRQIAEALFLSERTVETHRKNIFRKTKTNSVIGLIKFAYERKLI